MRKILFRTSALFTLLIQLSNLCFGFDRIAEFPKRTLLIELKDDEPEVIKELGTNSEAIELYKANNTKYNENVKYAFKEFWGDKKQEFMLHGEIEKLSEDNQLKYAVLSYKLEKEEKINFFKYTLKMGNHTVNKKGVKKFEENEREYNVSVENEIPSRADLLFLITKLKMYFDIEEVFDRVNLEALLAKKTLLLDKENVEMEKQEIVENYPFPYKIVERQEIFNLAEQRDKNSLYLKLDIDYKDKMILINFMIIDCETGKILSRCNITGLGNITFNEPSEKSKNDRAQHMAQMSGQVYHGPRGGDQRMGKEILRLHTAKAKLKGKQLKYLSSTKKQLTYFKNLMIY